MNNTKHNTWFRAFAACLVFVFTLTSIPCVEEARALAIWSASQKIPARREMWRVALEKTRIKYADSEGDIKLLRDNKTSVLLQPAERGFTYLVSPELSRDTLGLLRAVIERDIRAVVQIIAWEDPKRYEGMKELLKSRGSAKLRSAYYSLFPDKRPASRKDLPMEDMLMSAFGLLTLEKRKMLYASELLPAEKDLLLAAEAIVKSGEGRDYFTAIFFDTNVSDIAIRIAMANDKAFYRVSALEKAEDLSLNMGLKLKGFRAELRVDEWEFGELLGRYLGREPFKTAFISHLETGKRRVPPAILLAAEALVDERNAELLREMRHAIAQARDAEAALQRESAAKAEDEKDASSYGGAAGRSEFRLPTTFPFSDRDGGIFNPLMDLSRAARRFGGWRVPILLRRGLSFMMPLAPSGGASSVSAKWKRITEKTKLVRGMFVWNEELGTGRVLEVEGKGEDLENPNSEINITFLNKESEEFCFSCHASAITEGTIWGWFYMATRADITAFKDARRKAKARLRVEAPKVDAARREALADEANALLKSMTDEPDKEVILRPDVNLLRRAAGKSSLSEAAMLVTEDLVKNIRRRQEERKKGNYRLENATVVEQLVLHQLLSPITIKIGSAGFIKHINKNLEEMRERFRKKLNRRGKIKEEAITKIIDKQLQSSKAISRSRKPLDLINKWMNGLKKKGYSEKRAREEIRSWIEEAVPNVEVMLRYAFRELNMKTGPGGASGGTAAPMRLGAPEIGGFDEQPTFGLPGTLARLMNRGAFLSAEPNAPGGRSEDDQSPKPAFAPADVGAAAEEPAPPEREGRALRDKPAKLTSMGEATLAFRLMNAMLIRSSVAERVFVQITPKCPLGCDICVARDVLKAGKDADKDILYSIFNQLEGIKNICLEGPGETMAYGKRNLLEAGVSQDFIDVVRRAATAAEEVWIITSGYLIPDDEEEAKKFFSQFPKNVVWWISADKWHEEKMMAKTKRNLRDIVRTMERLAEEGLVKTAYNIRIQRSFEEPNQFIIEKHSTLKHFGLLEKSEQDRAHVSVRRIIQQGSVREKRVAGTRTFRADDLEEHVYDPGDFLLYIDTKGNVVTSAHAVYMPEKDRQKYAAEGIPLVIANINDDSWTDIVIDKLLFENSLGYIVDPFYFVNPITYQKNTRLTRRLFEKAAIGGVAIKEIMHTMVKAIFLYAKGEAGRAESGVKALLAEFESKTEGMKEKKRVRLRKALNETMINLSYFLFMNTEDMNIPAFMADCLGNKVFHSSPQFRPDIKVAMEILRRNGKLRSKLLRDLNPGYRGKTNLKGLMPTGWIENLDAESCVHCPVYTIHNIRPTSFSSFSDWGADDAFHTDDFVLYALNSDSAVAQAAKKFAYAHDCAESGVIKRGFGILYVEDEDATYYIEERGNYVSLFESDNLWIRLEGLEESSDAVSMLKSMGAFAAKLDEAGIKFNPRYRGTRVFGEHHVLRGDRWTLVDTRGLSRAPSAISSKKGLLALLKRLTRKEWRAGASRLSPVGKERQENIRMMEKLFNEGYREEMKRLEGRESDHLPASSAVPCELRSSAMWWPFGKTRQFAWDQFAGGGTVGRILRLLRLGPPREEPKFFAAGGATPEPRSILPLGNNGESPEKMAIIKRESAAMDIYAAAHNKAPNMEISINPDIEEAGVVFACEVIKEIQARMRRLPNNKKIVINFCTGDTPWIGYTKMAYFLDFWDKSPEIRAILNRYGVDTKLKPDMSRVVAYPLDAVFPQKRTDYHSFANILNNMFERLHIPQENRHLFYGDIYEDRTRMSDGDFAELMRDIEKNGLIFDDDPGAAGRSDIQTKFINAMRLQAERMSKEIEDLGGAHIFLSGVGPSYAGKGHVGFMESGTPFGRKAFIGAAHFHISAGHAKENGGLRNFYVNGRPKCGFITFGFHELLLRQGNPDIADDVKVIVVSTGNAKNNSIYRGIEGEYDPAYPLSGLQRSRGIFVLDNTSAINLRIKKYPWEFYRIDDWGKQAVKEFFVRVSSACGKKIIDLTEDDFLRLPDGGSEEVRKIKRYNLGTLKKLGTWDELRIRVIQDISAAITTPDGVAARLGLKPATNDGPTEVVIINPHLDDEYLAMADTIEELVRAGYQVSTYYMQKGYTAVDEQYVAGILNYIKGWTREELAAYSVLDEKELTGRLAKLIKDNNLHVSPSDYDVWSHMGAEEKRLRAQILFLNMNRKLKGALAEKEKLEALVDFLIAASNLKESWGSKDVSFMSDIKVFIRTTEAKSALMSRGMDFEDIHAPWDMAYGAEGRNPTVSPSDIETVKNILVEKNKSGRLGLVISNGEGFPDYGAHSTVEITVTRVLLELMKEGEINPDNFRYLQYAGVWERIGTDQAELSVVCPAAALERFEREFRQYYPSQAPPPVPDSGFTEPMHFSAQVVDNSRKTRQEIIGLLGATGHLNPALEESEAGILNYKVFDFTKADKREEIVSWLRSKVRELDNVRPIVDNASNLALNGPVPFPDVVSMVEHVNRLEAAGIRLKYILSVEDLKRQLKTARLARHRNAAKRALSVIGTPEALKALAENPPAIKFIDNHDGILNTLKDFGTPVMVINFDAYSDLRGASSEGAWIAKAKATGYADTVVTCPRGWRKDEGIVRRELAKAKKKGLPIVVSFCFDYFSLGKESDAEEGYHTDLADVPAEVEDIVKFIEEDNGVEIASVVGARSEKYLHPRADLDYIKSLEHIIYSVFKHGRPPLSSALTRNNDEARAEEWELLPDGEGKLQYALRIFSGGEKMGEIHLTIKDKGIILRPCEKGLEVCEIRKKHGTKLLLQGLIHAAELARERGLSPEWALVYYEDVPVEIAGDVTYGLSRFLESLGFSDSSRVKIKDEGLKNLIRDCPGAGATDRFSYRFAGLENIRCIAKSKGIKMPAAPEGGSAPADAGTADSIPAGDGGSRKDEAYVQFGEFRVPIEIVELLRQDLLEKTYRENSIGFRLFAEKIRDHWQGREFLQYVALLRGLFTIDDLRQAFEKNEIAFVALFTVMKRDGKITFMKQLEELSANTSPDVFAAFTRFAKNKPDMFAYFISDLARSRIEEILVTESDWNDLVRAYMDSPQISLVSFNQWKSDIFEAERPAWRHEPTKKGSKGGVASWIYHLDVYKAHQALAKNIDNDHPLSNLRAKERLLDSVDAAFDAIDLKGLAIGTQSYVKALLLEEVLKKGGVPSEFTQRLQSETIPALRKIEAFGKRYPTLGMEPKKYIDLDDTEARSLFTLQVRMSNYLSRVKTPHGMVRSMVYPREGISGEIRITPTVYPIAVLLARKMYELGIIDRMLYSSSVAGDYMKEAPLLLTTLFYANYPPGTALSIAPDTTSELMFPGVRGYFVGASVDAWTGEVLSRKDPKTGGTQTNFFHSAVMDLVHGGEPLVFYEKDLRRTFLFTTAAAAFLGRYGIKNRALLEAFTAFKDDICRFLLDSARLPADDFGILFKKKARGGFSKDELLQVLKDLEKHFRAMPQDSKEERRRKADLHAEFQEIVEHHAEIIERHIFTREERELVNMALREDFRGINDTAGPAARGVSGDKRSFSRFDMEDPLGMRRRGFHVGEPRDILSEIQGRIGGASSSSVNEGATGSDEGEGRTAPARPSPGNPYERRWMAAERRVLMKFIANFDFTKPEHFAVPKCLVSNDIPGDALCKMENNNIVFNRRKLAQASGLKERKDIWWDVYGQWYTKKMAEYWNNIVGDGTGEHYSDKKFGARIRKVERVLRNNEVNVRGKSVLDIGTGDGSSACAAVSEGAKFVCGIDISKKSLAIARKKARERSLDIRYLNKSVAEIASVKTEFDVVIAIDAMSYLPHHMRLKALKQIFENIPTGASIFIYEDFRFYDGEWTDKEWINALEAAGFDRWDIWSEIDYGFSFPNGIILKATKANAAITGAEDASAPADAAGADAPQSDASSAKPNLKTPLAADAVTAEQVLSKICSGEDEINSAKMIDRLEIGPGDKVLCIGAGLKTSHPISCAVRGANVTIVQPDFYGNAIAGSLSPQNVPLESAILDETEAISGAFDTDLIGNRIDLESYRCDVQSAGLPSAHYSYVFLLNVIGDVNVSGHPRDIVASVLASARDNAIILVSSKLESDGDVRMFKDFAQVLGYLVESCGEFEGKEMVYAFKIHRKQPTAATQEAPAVAGIEFVPADAGAADVSQSDASSQTQSNSKLSGYDYAQIIRTLALSEDPIAIILEIDGGLKLHGGIRTLEAIERGLPASPARTYLGEVIEAYRQKNNVHGRKELIVSENEIDTFVPDEPGFYVEAGAEQEKVLESGKPLQFSEGGLIYHERDGLDEAILNGYLTGDIKLTRLAHAWATSSFNKESSSPAIFVVKSGIFNRLLQEGRAALIVKGMDPYPTINSPFSIENVEEIWISEDTYDRYRAIVDMPKTDIEKRLKQRLQALLESGKLKVILNLRHKILPPDLHERFVTVRTHIKTYMFYRDLYAQFPALQALVAASADAGAAPQAPTGASTTSDILSEPGDAAASPDRMAPDAVSRDTENIEFMDSIKHDSVYYWISEMIRLKKWSNDYTLINFDFHADDDSTRPGMNDGSWVQYAKEKELIGQYQWVYHEKSIKYSLYADHKTGDPLSDLADSARPVIVTFDLDYFITKRCEKISHDEIDTRIKRAVDGLIAKGYVIKGINISHSIDEIHIDLEDYTTNKLKSELARLPGMKSAKTLSTNPLPEVPASVPEPSTPTAPKDGRDWPDGEPNMGPEGRDGMDRPEREGDQSPRFEPAPADAAGAADEVEENTATIEGIECNLAQGFHFAPADEIASKIITIYRSTGIKVFFKTAETVGFFGPREIDDVVRAKVEGASLEELKTRLPNINIVNSLFNGEMDDFEKCTLDEIFDRYKEFCTKQILSLAIMPRGSKEESKYDIVIVGNYPEHILREVAEYMRDYSREELLLEPRMQKESNALEAVSLKTYYNDRWDSMLKQIRTESGSIPKGAKTPQAPAGETPMPPEDDETGTPRPTVGSECAVDTAIINIFDGLYAKEIVPREAAGKFAEAARKFMEEVLPMWAHSEDHVSNFPCAFAILKEVLKPAILKKALKENALEWPENVFAREAVDILERHKNDDDQAELREELVDLMRRIFGVKMFFAAYKWCLKVREMKEAPAAELCVETEELRRFIEAREKLNMVTAKEKYASGAVPVLHYMTQVAVSFGQGLLMSMSNAERLLGDSGSDADFRKHFKLRLSMFEKAMAALGYFILNSQLANKENYDRHDLIKNEVMEELAAGGHTIDRVAAELKATLNFENASVALKAAAREDYTNKGKELSDEIATLPEQAAQSLILYADDILETAAVMDFEDTMRKAKAILKDGKIILFARKPENATILERMIKRADSNIDVITITKDELRNTNGSELNEVKSLVNFAKQKGAKDILAVIRGPIGRQTEQSELDAMAKFLTQNKIPLIIVGSENALYSFAQAITRAISTKTQDGTRGWLITLGPIKPLSGELQQQYDKYINSLQALQAA